MWHGGSCEPRRRRSREKHCQSGRRRYPRLNSRRAPWQHSEAPAQSAPARAWPGGDSQHSEVTTTLSLTGRLASLLLASEDPKDQRSAWPRAVLSFKLMEEAPTQALGRACPCMPRARRALDIALCRGQSPSMPTGAHHRAPSAPWSPSSRCHSWRLPVPVWHRDGPRAANGTASANLGQHSTRRRFRVGIRVGGIVNSASPGGPLIKASPFSGGHRDCGGHHVRYSSRLPA